MLHKFFTSQISFCLIASIFLSGCTIPYFTQTSDTDTSQAQIAEIPVVEETQPTVVAPIELEKQQRESESDTNLDAE